MTHTQWLPGSWRICRRDGHKWVPVGRGYTQNEAATRAWQKTSKANPDREYSLFWCGDGKQQGVTNGNKRTGPVRAAGTRTTTPRRTDANAV